LENESPTNWRSRLSALLLLLQQQQLIMWRHTKSLGQVEIMARAQIEAKPEQ
jgi:hypothetical protein